jgi:3-oxoacyl-[acyl-carrier-protein] synthase II
MRNPSGVVLTGLGSVSAFGPCRGPITGPAPALRDISRWPTDGVRRGHLVPPFQPAQVVPGLKTRRMDRLSVWAVVAAHLALEDAGLKPTDLVSDRVGVAFGTAFGCVELTEAFMVSIATSGHAKADPAVFPETLPNMPASHVARLYGFRGPNVTLSAWLMSGEAAMLDAAAQIESNEASVAVVLAGDVISRAVFAWYEEAGCLAPACCGTGTAGDVVPGEGVGALILESREHAEARNCPAYASVAGTALEGRETAGGWDGLVAGARATVDRGVPLRFVMAGSRVRMSEFDATVPTVTPHLEIGMFGGGGLVGLSRAFGTVDSMAPGLGLVLAAGASGQRLAVALLVGKGGA